MNAQTTQENNAINNTDTAPVPVIFRRDAAGNKVAFLQSSLDLSEEGGKISVWHGKGRDLNTVPLSYYHATTKLSDVEETDLARSFAEDYVPRFGLQIRKRLGKDLSSHKTAPKSANDSLRRATDKAPEPVLSEMDLKLKALETALTVGISTAISEVFKQFSVSFANK